MSADFFIQRPAVTPTIYVYTLPGVASHNGYIKVGYTERDVEKRIYEQTHTSGVKAQILLRESAMRPDGSCFTDHDIHRILERRGFHRLNAGNDRNEWFNCKVEDVGAAITELKTGVRSDGERTATFRMRPEQVCRGAHCGLFQKSQVGRAGASPEISLECQNAFWQDICFLRAGKENGTLQNPCADLQTRS